MSTERTPKESTPKASTHHSRKGMDPGKTLHLEIHLKSGVELPAMDITGLSDPYVVFKIGDESVKSQIKYQTLNPKWDERLLLFCDKDTFEIEVEVYDWDPFKTPDFMGSAKVRLTKVLKDQEYPFNHIGIGKQEGTVSFTVTPRNIGDGLTEKIIAVFGTQESGKSTLMKQYLFSHGISESEELVYREMVYANLLRLCKIILNKMAESKKSLHVDCKFRGDYILEIWKDAHSNARWGSIDGVYHLHGFAKSMIAVFSDQAFIAMMKMMKSKDRIPYNDNIEVLLEPNGLKRLECGENLLYIREDLIQFGRFVLNDENAFQDKGNLDKEVEALLLRLEKDKNTDALIRDFEKKSHLLFSTKFYLLNWKKFEKMVVNDSIYIPILQDYLFHSVATHSAALIDRKRTVNDCQLILAETSGSRPYRKKWQNLLTSNPIFGLIYLIDLSAYDEFNEDGVNRMQEDLEAIGEFCTSMKSSLPAILFFNKLDLFQKKMLTSDMKKYFKDYTGGNNYALGLKYIVQKYRDAYSGDHRHLYTNIGSCLNVKQINKALAVLVGLKGVFFNYKTSGSTGSDASPIISPFPVKKVEPSNIISPRETMVTEKIFEQVVVLDGLIKSDTFYERVNRQKSMSSEELAKEESEFRLESSGSTCGLVEKAKCQLCNDQIALIELSSCKELFCNECYTMMASAGCCPVCDAPFDKIRNIFTGQVLQIE